MLFVFTNSNVVLYHSDLINMTHTYKQKNSIDMIDKFVC